MSDQPVLGAAPRNVLGKKVKTLRLEGLLPANVYGRAVDSTAIQTDAKAFTHFITTDAIRGVFGLHIEGEAEPRRVLLKSLERRGGTGTPIHADFLQVDMSRPVTMTVPLKFAGDPPAVRDLAGTLVLSTPTVRVRCLPGDIPAAINVDLTKLRTYTSVITVGSLEVAKGIEVLADPTRVLASIVPPRLGEELRVAVPMAPSGDEDEDGETAEQDDAEE